MHKKSFVLCGLACIAGIFGAFARWLQNSSAFEEGTGLAIPGAGWSTVVAAILCALALVFFFAVRRAGSRGNMAEGMEYPSAFSGSPVVRSIAAIAAPVIMAAGGIITVAGALGSDRSLFELIYGGFVIITAIFVFMIFRGIKSPGKKGGGAALIMVVLFLCFRLIAEYKTSASDPVIWHFGIRILAVSASTLAYYYLAGYCFLKPKPHRTLYFCLLAVFLNIITFADSVSLAYHLVTAGLTLALLALTFLFVGNAYSGEREKSQPDD